MGNATSREEAFQFAIHLRATVNHSSRARGALGVEIISYIQGKRGAARATRCLLLLVLSIVAGTAKEATAGLVFDFTAASNGVPQEVIDGFVVAGQRWSSVFLDDVTINIDIAFSSFPSLGITLFDADNYSYTDVRNALGANVSSGDDLAAFNQLPTGSSVNMLINRTSNSPHGVGSTTPYLDNDGDANNTLMAVPHGNAKALGLRDAHAPERDALIVMDSGTAWDFDPTNGISRGRRDFVGVATHELGHALGFLSGVDALDGNSSSIFYPDDFFTYVGPMDLFRYSTESVLAGPGIIDWTVDTRDKYFSLDGGLTPIESFSTGDFHGDGAQASHWIASSPAIMNPHIPAGVTEMITPVDIRLLDVIGWDTVPVQVHAPEPSSLALFGIGTLALLATTARRRKRR